jgi:predicted aminopeptidase
MLWLGGCNSLSYYGQAISGHLDLLSREKPITDLLDSDQIDADLKTKLRLALSVRDFASHEIQLPENDSYRNYADLERPFAVWNVIAAPKYSVQPHKWCYLIVGCLSYRGYFSPQDAKAMAEEMKAQGMDVIISGAAAYSTLGWMDDPLLNTIVRRDETTMIGVIFHELAHQVVYVDGDTAFNEAFATAVEYESLRRWYASTSNEQAYVLYREKKRQQGEMHAKLRATQQALDAIYKQDIPDTQKEQAKQRTFAELKTWYQAWREHNSYDGFDGWMKGELNNAYLALVATYQEMVPDFEAALVSVNGDMPKFFALVKTLSDLDNEARREKLKSYRQPQTASQ